MADGDDFREGPGEVNVGALVGGAVGSIGGLLAVGIPPAIVFHSLQAMFSTPKIAVICFFISGLLGLVIGGQVGLRIRRWTGNLWAEIASGAVAGLIPAIAVLIWSYQMVTSY